MCNNSNNSANFRGNIIIGMIFPGHVFIDEHSQELYIIFTFKRISLFEALLYILLVYNKTVDSAERAPRLATQTPDILCEYILKQWIALNSRADWLVKLRISCAIYL